MSSISLVMIVRNEERCLRRCLDSAAPYMDEIVIVDTGSTDATKQIAREYGAKLFDFEWAQDFSAARNYALEQSTSGWNLILDADEWIEQFDLLSVQGFLQKQQTGRIERISETDIDGERSETRDFITRLIPKGIKYVGRIHEQVDTNLPRVNLPIIVKHDGYIGVSKSGRNIPLLLLEIEDHPDDPYFHYQIAKEYKGIHQVKESQYHFEKAYNSLTGYERYAPNVVVDYIQLLMNLKDYNKILELISQPYVWSDHFPDFHFTCGVFYLDLILSNPEKYLSYLSQIEACYRRCLIIGEAAIYDSVIGVGSFAAWYNLGNYYEVQGQLVQAIQCYKESASMGFNKAIQRLKALS